jgi:hypothetical protein
MPGGSPGGKRGVTHTRGHCPNCYRNVPGGRDHQTGDTILRAHKTPNGDWCSDRQRVTALTELDIAIRYVWGRPIPGAPEPSEGFLEHVREKFGPAAATEPTGCPACGSDDYIPPLDANGAPDYGGVKECQNCGETWQ